MSRMRNEGAGMMRCEADAVGRSSRHRPEFDGGLANVVVVKVARPFGQGLSAGQDLSASAKITLQGGDIVTVLGPSSARRRCAGRATSTPARSRLRPPPVKRGRFGALRAAEVAHNPEHLGHRRYPERKDLRAPMPVQAPALASGHRGNGNDVQIRSSDGAPRI